MKSKKTIQDDIDATQALQDAKKYCEYCGHTMYIAVWRKTKICNWCQRENKNDTKARFKYMIYKIQKEEDDDDN